MNERALRWLARSLGALTLLLMIAAIALTVGDTTTSAGDIPSIVFFAVGLATFALIGVLVATRAPHNPIGWLYGVVGLSMMTNIAAHEYAIRGSSDLDLPGLAAAGWISSATVTPTFAALLLSLLLFPDGSPPTPRWRVLTWTIVIGAAAGLMAISFVPSSFEIAEADARVANPLQVAAIEGWTWLSVVATALVLAGAIGAVAAILIRFWRSEGEERQQLRWLASAAGLTVVSIVGVFAAGQDSQLSDVAWVFFVFSIMVALPGATAVAVLRYRLYDLDLVIKKTVIFAITVVLIMVVGLGVLLAVSGPLTDLAPDETQAVFVAGFVIGALAWPLWRLARRIGDRLVYGGRSTPYEALTQFSERLSEAYATDDVLPRMAAILGKSTRAAEARVWLRVGDAFRPAAAWPSTTDPGSRVAAGGDTLPQFPGSDQAVEVRHRGELLGALSVESRPDDPIGVERTKLMRDLAAQAGLVLRNVRLIEELRASRQRLVAAQDQERRRLERNIHDGAPQQLVALGVKLRLADSLVDRDTGKAHTMLTQLQTETQVAIDDLRDLARGIYPPLLADKGLGAALEAQARKVVVPTTVVTDGMGRFPQDVESAVYFSVLEALQNVVKYAEASSATVILAQTAGTLTFTVADDGRGFDVAATSFGTGLQGIGDRLAAVGGTLDVSSQPDRGTTGHGTTLHGSVPIGAPA
ncbi:MAG: GAF domain-containing sensor histidine kinase [Actinomycetota bacterium]|nr:GAF domain-containing sensor histidine kinase [Actinomycetota bacterium]